MAQITPDTLENDEKTKKEEQNISSHGNGPPAIYTLIVMIVIVGILWTFFPYFIFMSVMFLGSLLVVYSSHVAQSSTGKEFKTWFVIKLYNYTCIYYINSCKYRIKKIMNFKINISS